MSAPLFDAPNTYVLHRLLTLGPAKSWSDVPTKPAIKRTRSIKDKSSILDGSNCFCMMEIISMRMKMMAIAPTVTLYGMILKALSAKSS